MSGARGIFPGRRITAGAKTHNNAISTFSKQYICFPKTSGSNMGAPNFFLVPGAIQPRYAPTHHDCLARMAKFVYKITCPSVANYQSQKIWNKMLSIIEIIWPLKIPWRSKKRYIISKTSTTFPPPHKTLGVCVEKNIPKNSKAIMHFAITRGFKMIRQYFSTSQRETRSLQ